MAHERYRETDRQDYYDNIALCTKVHRENEIQKEVNLYKYTASVIR